MIVEIIIPGTGSCGWSLALLHRKGGSISVLNFQVLIT